MQLKDRAIVVVVSKIKTNCALHVSALNNYPWQKHRSTIIDFFPTTYLDASQ